MKINAAFILSLLAVIVLNISCVHYYYAPNSNNVTLFKQKNELQVKAYSCSNTPASGESAVAGYEVQTAYAVGNHTAIQLNFLHAGEQSKDDGSGSGNYIEAAAGYYKPFNNGSWVFENYAGFGFGAVRNNYDGYSFNKAKTTFNKFFMQPSFGYSGAFDVALSLKFSVVNYGVNSSNFESGGYNSDDIKAIQNNKFHFYPEPGLMVRAGSDKIKVSLQYTHSFTGKDPFPVTRENVSLGIVLPFKIKKGNHHRQ